MAGCGKFGSGREKAALGSSQSGVRQKKKKHPKKQKAWNAAKVWNGTPPPFEMPYFSFPLSLFFLLQFFTTTVCTALLFPLPSHFPTTAYVSQCLLTVFGCLDFLSWLWSISLSLSLSQTDSFSQQRKREGSWTRVKCFEWLGSHPSKCVLKP